MPVTLSDFRIPVFLLVAKDRWVKAQYRHSEPVYFGLDRLGGGGGGVGWWLTQRSPGKAILGTSLKSKSPLSTLELVRKTKSLSL